MSMLCTNAIAFKLPPEAVGRCKAIFRITTGWKGTTAPFPVELALNGTPIGTIASVEANSNYRFRIPTDILSEENELTLSIPNDTEHLIRITRYRMELRPLRGGLLILR